MLKIQQVKIKGFRGILEEQVFEFQKGISSAIYGLNSNGKSSIVDGLEWFLSKRSEIFYLTREDAGEKAYPHASLTKGDSYVEINFIKENSNSLSLKKTFNFKTPTKPLITNQIDFENVYKSFIISPYLRYSEIAKFVLSSKTEKYISLASWMGFGYILDYQEKLRINVDQVSTVTINLQGDLERTKKEIFNLISDVCTPENIVIFINNILTKYKLKNITSVNELSDVLIQFQKLLPNQAISNEYKLLSKTESTLSSISFNETLLELLKEIENKIETIKQNRENIHKLEQIDLYQSGLDLISKKTDNLCPLCDLPWNSKDDLLAHVKSKLNLLTILKQQNSVLKTEIAEILQTIETETTNLTFIFNSILEVNKELQEKDFQNLTSYRKLLLEFKKYFLDSYLTTKIIFPKINNLNISVIKDDLLFIRRKIDDSKNRLNIPSEFSQLLKDFSNISRVIELYKIYNNTSNELDFKNKQLKIVYGIKDQIGEKIKTEIENRFNEISEKVQKYFKILRPDKSISNIKIDLVNRTKGSDKSAELSLDFYDTSISPAYKILSESLLNSLGLSIYLSCVKTYNTNCGFVIFDDIINSLDRYNRENVIKLFREELKDYQLLILTHDEIWFERLKSNFPDWKRYKIIDWTYEKGPIFMLSKSTKEEIEQLLADPQLSKLAGTKLGEHMEDTLNILCENTEAVVKHRYKHDEPFCLGELFDSIIKRLKDLKDNTLSSEAVIIKNDEVFLRNYSAHNRRNMSSSLDPEEIRTFVIKWFEFENKITCKKCNSIISYTKKGDYRKLECDCGELKIPISK